MKTRLALFSLALLLLPALSAWLSGQGLPEHTAIAGKAVFPTLIAGLVMAVATLLLDAHTQHRSGSSLLHTQRLYAAWLSAVGAALGVLLAYLNFYAASWMTSAGSLAQSLLLAALLGAVLLPGVLVTRLWLAGFPGLLRSLTRMPALPEFRNEPAASLLLLAALCGLLGGASWPAQLFWLLWLSPLLLLAALQLLWHESTIFSGLNQGDWSRILLASLSGLLAGGLALAAYMLAGSAVHFSLPVPPLSIMLGLALFGLLCLQLGDIIAEYWRGKQRPGLSQKRKKFPIPVVVKPAIGKRD